MALNNTNIPSSASDVVGIFDQNFNQVFPLARPVKVTVHQLSKPMEHPVELGTIITDNRIIMPTEIEVSMILPGGAYRSVYQQINQIFTSAQLLNVQTRTSTYPNMFIVELPHDEDAEMFDTVAIGLKMKQVLIVTTQTQALPATAVANTNQQSTINLGSQNPGSSYPLPPPTVDGPGSALPQIPPPPNRSTLNVPVLPPPSPINNAQYEQIYGGVTPITSGQ
jgi:Dit-like tail protein